MVDLKKPKRTLMELILEKKKQQYKLKMYKNNIYKLCINTSNLQLWSFITNNKQEKKKF